MNQEERVRDEFGRRIDDLLLSQEYSTLSDPNLKIVMVHISYMNMKLNKIEEKLDQRCATCPETQGLWKVVKIGGAGIVAIIPVAAAYFNHINNTLALLQQALAAHLGKVIP